jgi:hypothetical protein
MPWATADVVTAIIMAVCDEDEDGRISRGEFATFAKYIKN